MPVHMHREIEKLKKRILSMSALVADSIRKAVKALKERDELLANAIIESDGEIDRLEVEIEEECLKILALYNPVAQDLRFIVTVLKINNDLERIADQAVNIADRAKFLASQMPIPVPYELTLMVEKTQAMLENTLTALINIDTQLAQQVIDADDEVDDLHRQMYSIIQGKIRENLDRMDCLISILVVSRHLERIADQVTNIAEDIFYMVEGKIVRHGGGQVGAGD